MNDSDYDFLMKNPDFVHGYAMAMVHNGQQLADVLKRSSDYFSKYAASIIQSYIDGSDAWEDWESCIHKDTGYLSIGSTSNRERDAIVYLCAGTESTYRIRVEKYGGPPGWVGGKVLWGFDQDNEADAVKIAKQWVDEGVLPDGFKEQAAFTLVS